MHRNDMGLHPDQGRIVRSITRPKPETIQALAECYTAFVLDHVGKYGAMEPSIQPLSPGSRMCGPAVTCLGPDLTVRRMAIDLAEPGDVVVVAANGSTDYACFGDGTARRMQLKQIAGIVIDGATRDAAGIRRLQFPTFVKGVTPRNYYYPTAPTYGAINVPVTCGGARVNPGDVIIGDDDGVIVVSREAADHIASTVLSNLRREQEARLLMTEFQPFNLEDELLERGYHFE